MSDQSRQQNSESSPVPAGLDPDVFTSGGMGSGAGDPLGGFDLSSLLGAAQEMQAQMQAAQAEVEERVFDGVSGGGMVKVSITGATVVQGVSIDPTAVDPDDVAMLEDLVCAAISDALAQVSKAQNDSLGGVLPGDLSGSISGLFGG